MSSAGLLIFDVETESTASLDAGPTDYARHRDTRLDRVAWDFAGRETVWAVASGPDLMQLFLADIDAADGVGAFNAEFDATVLRYLLPAAFERARSKIFCIQHQARAAGIRPEKASLENCARLAGVDVPKKDAAALAATGYAWAAEKGAAARDLFADAEDTGAREAARDAYVLQDVRLAKALCAALPPLSAFERESFLTALQMNMAGLPIDVPLVRACDRLGRAAVDAVAGEFERRIGYRPTQREKVRAALARQGLKLDDMRGATLDAALERDDLAEELRWALSAYETVNSKPFQRFARILELVGEDARLRHCIGHAKTHTGRDGGAGGRVNVHNSARPSSSQEVRDAIADALTSGVSLEEVEVLFGDPVQALLDSQRSVIAAPPGFVLLVADFDKAEPSCGNWLTGDAEVEDAYRKVAVSVLEGMRKSLPDATFWAHPLVSEIGYRDAYNTADISKSSALYAVGKAGWLGSGYGQSAGGLVSSLAARGITVPAEVGDAVIASCRQLKPKTFEFGEAGIAALTAAAARKATTVLCDGLITVRPYSLGVEMVLPSGRAVRYRGLNAKVSMGAFGQKTIRLAYTPENARSSRGKDLCRAVHLGTVLENAFSATARDFLYEAANNCRNNGLNPILQVHDELVCLEPNDSSLPERIATMHSAMNTPPTWARGYHLTAQVDVCRRYTK